MPGGIGDRKRAPDRGHELWPRSGGAALPPTRSRTTQSSTRQPSRNVRSPEWPIATRQLEAGYFDDAKASSQGMDDHFRLDLEAGRLKIEAAKPAGTKGAESVAEIGEVRFVQHIH